MKKSFLIILFISCFINIVFSKESFDYKIDSVFISFNQKIITNTNLNVDYKDEFILYNSNDTIISLSNKIKLKFLVNGSPVIGNYHGGQRTNYYYAEFSGREGTKIFVKIISASEANSMFAMYNIFKAILFIVATYVILFLILKKTIKNKSEIKKQIRSDGQIIVSKLEDLGYFKFISEKLVKELQDDLIDSINNYNILSTIENDDTLEPLDYRFYFCDGEDLYEEGGLISNLERVSSAFKKRGLKLFWSEEKYEITTEASNQSISINGKVYTNIYRESQIDDSWGLAAKYFYLMLNEQLTLQASQENIYPISGGNDGQFIILTKEQFDYISSIGLDSEWMPTELETWIKRNKL